MLLGGCGVRVEADVDVCDVGVERVIREAVELYAVAVGAHALARGHLRGRLGGGDTFGQFGGRIGVFADVQGEGVRVYFDVLEG
eukprot:2018565-Alexandrium_andersonii.AAC.1